MTRYPGWARLLRTVAWTLAMSAAVCVGSTQAARADNPPACTNAADSPYSLRLIALTGPSGADIRISVHTDAASGCPLPETLKKIQLKTFAADGSVARVSNATDVVAPSGVVTLDLGQTPRDRRVEVDVLVQTETPHQTFVVRGATRTLLRPDLVVERVVVPSQTLVGREIEAAAVIRERNGDIGATGNVTISALPGGTKPFEVAPGGTTTVSFTGLTFGSAALVELAFGVTDATPAETDATNNTRVVTVDVTEHELPEPRTVLFPSLGGYGAQFNNHLYAPITPMPPGGYGNVEDKVKALAPQLVRIFYNDNWDGNWNGQFPDWQANYASFVEVVQLAQEAGATVDISFQNLGSARTVPEPAMKKFADVLEDLVRNHGLTNVRWAEVGNEPNGTDGGVTLDQYNALYRALDAQLVARGLREQIHLMGGGLVERSNTGSRSHYEWLNWIGSNMGDVVDAYAEHVYWWYDKPGRLEYRLRDIYNLAANVLPPEQRKPMYMMEFGIRGYTTCGTMPAFQNRYYADCTEIWKTNIAAFQQLWFVIGSAQLGFAGTSKWDAYWAVYDKNSEKQQVHWMIGTAAEGYPLWPAYNAMSLVFHTTAPGWQIIRVAPWEDDDWGVPQYDLGGGSSGNDQAEKELAAYAGPNGELTVIGLDTHGKALNAVSTEAPASYSIGGLPPNTTFNLAVWNATGDGTNSIADPVTTNATGVARFSVPLQAAFALTTVPVS